ncbi:MAG: hypothetical protein ACE5GJ_14095 [Gemmatimonadota bacterium]
MPTPVHYVPILTTLVAALFAPVIFRRWRRRRPAPHLFWWCLGVAAFGVGTLTESITTLFGWSEPVFRAWYISGALLGGAPLAQGTVYLLLPRKVADRLTVALLTVIAVASALVLLSPIDHDAVEAHRLTGQVMEWRRARLVSPFINLYAAGFLIGGAIFSAWRFRRDPTARDRFLGNCFIAVGALLPGIGGTSARFGHTEVLYVTELVGLSLIWLGYHFNVRSPVRGAPTAKAGVTEE